MTSKSKVVFETQPCTRCGGAGYFECYAGIFEGRCFKCSGQRVTHTRRGASASKKFNERLDAIVRIPVSSIEVGMGVQVYAGEKFRTVESVEVKTSNRRNPDGTPSDIDDAHVTFVGKNMRYILPVSGTVKRASTVDEWNAVADSVSKLAGATITAKE